MLPAIKTDLEFYFHAREYVHYLGSQVSEQHRQDASEIVSIQSEAGRAV
jgi:hypothetical protein